MPAEGTRDALVDAAERLLDAGGPAAVTLRAVAGAVGVSHNAPYKHFASKEALLAAVAARYLRGYADLMAAAAAEAPPAVALRSSLHGHIDWAVRHPRRFELVYGPWTSADPELADAAHHALLANEQLAARAQADGALPTGDPIRAAALVRALAHGAAALAISGHLSADGKGHADPADLLDDLLAALARPTSSP